MPYDSVIQDVVKKLQAYHDDIRWRCCVGKYGSPKSLDRPDIRWEDASRPFEMPVGNDYWYRCRYTVPKKVQGIDVAGSKIILRSNVLTPIELYIDGKKVFAERFWADFRVPEVVVTERAKPGESYDLVIHYSPVPVFEHEKVHTFAWVEIEAVEEVAFHLMSFPHEMAYCAGFHELDSLNDAARARAEKEITPGRTPLQILRTIQAIRKSFEPASNVTKSRRVHLVGHAHIDMNWLWDMDDTIKVCGRDFTTMTRLINEFPGFTFSQSQAAVYDIAERHFPAVFKRMQKAVSSGAWEITAATWTEGDLNMANGETIARHMLYARNYLLDRFGMYTRVCWEPDTFGHPANMPQILNKSGIRYYFHMRTSEGGPRYFHAETPLYTWEGLDGSRVLVFTCHYGAEFKIDTITHISQVMKTRYNLDDAMFVYGVCDHGGGPTRRDIARIKTFDALPTVPCLQFSTSQAFFDAAVEHHPVNIPVWKGEMNPIFDGCYTSHADIKATNRQAENRLLEAEVAGTLAWIHGDSHPEGQLETQWRQLCFNQFHDIFDGCAIHSTYELAVPQNREIISRAAETVRESIEYVSRSIRTKASGKTIAVWNLLGFIRDDLVEFDLPRGMKACRIIDPEGNELASQVIDGKVLFIARDVPAMGYKTYTVVAGKKAPKQEIRQTNRAIHLSSPFLEVRVDKASGCILNMVDKTSGRVMIRQRDWSEGRNLTNNLFQVEYEIPHGMSAWIIGAISRAERLIRNAKVEIKATGPVVDVLTVEHRTGNSTIQQQIYFHKELERIDFHTRVDWQEQSDHKRDAPMLKVSFMPELTKSSRVTWDIPFGNVTRVADGTEFAALKWIDVSDEEAGFSLLNDSKYGFSGNGSTITMTCIRTSYDPDPVPDRGEHVFRYSLYPHAGDWKAAHTVRAAAAFNSPLIPVALPSKQKGPLPSQHGWIDLESEGSVVTCFKKAARSDALIVRLHETRGENRPFALRLDGLGARRVEEVSLVEDRAFAVLPLIDNVATGTLGPYEIKTLRIWR